SRPFLPVVDGEEVAVARPVRAKHRQGPIRPGVGRQGRGGVAAPTTIWPRKPPVNHRLETRGPESLRPGSEERLPPVVPRSRSEHRGGVGTRETQKGPEPTLRLSVKTLRPSLVALAHRVGQ